MVRRAHHGTHGGVLEAHLVGLFLEHPEGLGRDVALHRQVVPGGGQILADGEAVDVMRAHVAHHLQDFLIGLAQAHHQAGLAGHIGLAGLEVLQQLQRVLVVGARPCLLVQTWHGLQVVVHHVRGRRFQDVQRLVQTAAEVGHQHLDLGAGRVLADHPDAVGVVAGATVAQVVAVDGGDDHVLEAQRFHAHGQVVGLLGVQRVGAAMAHVTERTATGALVTHDHERCGALAEAFADVRAGGLLADRVQLVVAQDLLHLVEAAAQLGRRLADPVRLAQHVLDRNDLDGNARGLGFTLLLLARVDGRGSGALVGRGAGGDAGGRGRRALGDAIPGGDGRLRRGIGLRGRGRGGTGGL